jgi:LysM repeat protein
VSEPTQKDLAGRPPRDDQFFFGDAATPQSAPEVFRGLTPRITPADSTPTPRLNHFTHRTVKNGLPLLMTGSLAAGVGVTSSMPVYATENNSTDSESRLTKARASLQELITSAFVPVSHQVSKVVAPHLPDTYTVKKGDTLSSVAERFNFPTTLLLTLNGLSWNSILHEGQIVKLTTAPTKQKGMAPARSTDETYTVAAGDTLSSVAERFGLSITAVAEANGLTPTDQVFSGESLVIPGAKVSTADTSLAPNTPTGPSIVFASVSEPNAGDSEEETAEDTEADSEEDLTEQTGDPVGWDIAEAPTLRAKKPAPAPTPPPAPVVVEEEEEEEEDEPAVTVTVEKNTEGAITPLNDTRRANATVIVQVGRDLGVPDYGIVIALATAMQESSLRNINWGDRDSVGLYQQRPSSGWGTVEEIMDPVYATKAFFGGPTNPNPGRTRGLLDYSGWQSMELTVAAQKVQRSAYPEAYAKWEASAWAWLDELS